MDYLKGKLKRDARRISNFAMCTSTLRLPQYNIYIKAGVVLEIRIHDVKVGVGGYFMYFVQLNKGRLLINSNEFYKFFKPCVKPKKEIIEVKGIFELVENENIPV